MKLYFGNAITTATTLMLLALLGFIGWSVLNRTSIQYWGAQEHGSAGVRTCSVLLCSGAGRAGQDHSTRH